MQTLSTKIWNWVVESTFNDDNNNITNASD